ncbi:MAG: hypothetical protein F4203_04455 [Rhodobacteraceae bacterium]|nr:hypothetical protein [Paracoccaceae bacterium]
MKHIIQKILLSSIRQNIGILIKILDNIAIDNLPLKNSITMEKREGKVLWVQINSSIFTFLAEETTFRHINHVVRKSKEGIDRIVVTPLETEDRNITRPVFLSWVVNTNDRRCKVIHERHFTSYCKYLWWDIYVGKILGKLNRRKKRSLKRIFTDQSVQNRFIMESLMKLQNTRHFIDKDADVEDVFTQIREEWELRYARKGLGHAIMYRWQALKIGTELGLLELDRIIIKDICGRGRISSNLFAKIMEESEQLEKGIINSRTRKMDIVMRRHMLMYIIHQTTPHSLQEIGKIMGGRDHTTVINGLRKVTERMETSPVQQALLDQFCILFDNIRLLHGNPRIGDED